MDWADSIIRHGYNLAREVNATIFMIFTETGGTYEALKRCLESTNSKSNDHNCKEDNSDKNPKLKIVVTTPNEKTYNNLKNEKKIIPILMGYRNKYKSTMIKQAIIKLFEHNLIKKGDIIVAILGTPRVLGGTDTISLIEISNSSFLLKFYQFINSMDRIKRLVINEVLDIALEISMEGREGKPVGTIFVVGDSEKVLKMSDQLILNPFKGYNAVIFDKKVRGTIKELSSVDGAFIIGEKGEVISAGRYLDTSGGNLKLPLGLGARHYAAAAISKYTNAIAITVSESGGIVRIFKNGEIIVEINPNKLDRENIVPCV